ncbi:MAG: class I SAM-dependent methyltransferase [Acidovorax sp.]|uniref:class I SAM-dependent methyltransferase n=1 Tax=Acidovorax sp. TaxID=1872122 RepID=UPI003918AB09
MLVVGAGGGLELEDMAQAHPGWRLDGVDPSQPMLDLAAQRLESVEVSDRVAIHHGYVQSAPAGPFDGATCLLTFHFVPRGRPLREWSGKRIGACYKAQNAAIAVAIASTCNAADRPSPQMSTAR